MKMMVTRRTIVFVALLLLLMPNKAISGILSDDLWPEMGVFSFDAGLEPYFMSVRDSLLGEHRYRMCQVLVIPAFEREWVVYMIHEEGKPFTVIYLEHQPTEKDGHLFPDLSRIAEGED
jgi:hypothetical protein